MKTNKIVFAIIAMAILATAVAIVSCKKDNENILNASSPKGYTVRQAADIRQMEDPLTYIKDFKKKLTESKDNEAFNLDDAAWHLSCLANLEFCNVNVEYDDFQFDTLEMKVNVTDGVILSGDLRTAYEQMCTEIQRFKKGFNHCDQNLYFIKLSIDADGNAKIALKTTFTSSSKDLIDHTWYFSDEFSALLACNEYFSTDSTYLWNGLAATELQRILNLFEHHENVTYGVIGETAQCYFFTQDHMFNYPNCNDPYGSPFFGNSRTYTGEASLGTVFILLPEEMCYCLDSYLGLGYDYLDSNSICANEHPVNWVIDTDVHQFPLHRWPTSYHKLKLEYGQLITPNSPTPNDD